MNVGTMACMNKRWLVLSCSQFSTYDGQMPIHNRMTTLAALWNCRTFPCAMQLPTSRSIIMRYNSNAKITMHRNALKKCTI